ncbi:hypothetical protein PV11_02626 [Exophiala sideris]|uniref:Putative phospholipase n=1 Tax=Exophiala sideris TaxID=1016849 RepID=A0A0D1WE69_9EURO|nr:hypothetical protein PV11_02626 [Exophiala sideris]
MLSYLNPFPSLPDYTGPHKVGSTEYEISLASLGLQPLPEDIELSTVKFRLFYPATAAASTRYGVPWLQEPQTEYLDGYLRLARAKPWLRNIVQSIPYYLRSTRIPAYENAPLSSSNAPLPVVIFSHGIIGNMNTHSAILGELASYGVFCAAIEHRDGSGALSIVRNDDDAKKAPAPTEITSIGFRQVSLKIKPGVYEQRDEQLQIRLFELMATFRALEMLNEGLSVRNLASSADDECAIPKGALNLTPSSVTWAGHSFGGTTLIQFMKSIYYNDRKEDNNYSLLMQSPSPTLKAQITPTSPLVLLDPWYLPLKSTQTRWLYERPLPCHHSDRKASDNDPARTVVISCEEFAHHWPECHSHLPAIIAQDPTSVKVQTDEEYHKEYALYTSPRDYVNKSKKAKAQAALNAAVKGSSENEASEKEVDENAKPISMVVLHDTTHITHSDFGVMFSWFVWWFTGQKAPELAVQNTARCILEAGGLPAADDAARMLGRQGTGAT